MIDKGQKIRIAIYLPSLSGGGAERVMVTLANGFAGRGYDIDLVLAGAEGPYLKDVSASVRVVDLGCRRVMTSLPGLVRYLRRERPVAMLSAMMHANLVAVMAARLAGAKTRLVVSERNAVSPRINSKQSWAFVLLMRWLYPHASRIQTNSSGLADDLSATLGVAREKIAVIYNPVDLAAVRRLGQAPLAHKWFEPGEPPVVLGIGRLTEQKDFCTLIQAFALLRAKREARLIILGEGKLRAELEGLVERLGLTGDVVLPGFADNPFAYMRRAALFVLSSKWEGFSNVLVEAMACGTPVVSTDCPSGSAEILENGKWGGLVPVGNAAAMAEAMERSLDHPGLPPGARAAQFSVETAVDAYLDLLLETK